MAGEADAFILLVLAIIFPPAAVAFLAGCGVDFCINLLLTLLGWFPGCLHAFWLIIKRSEANEMYGYQNWIYSGMGRYRPRTQGTLGVARYSDQPPPPPPPPSGQPPPPPPQERPGGGPPPSEAPVDQKTAPPPASADQKYSGDQAPPMPPAPTDEK